MINKKIMISHHGALTQRDHIGSSDFDNKQPRVEECFCIENKREWEINFEKREVRVRKELFVRKRVETLEGFQE